MKYGLMIIFIKDKMRQKELRFVLCPAHSEPEGRTSSSTSPMSLNTVSVLISPIPAYPDKKKVTQEVQYQNKQDGRIMKKNSAYSSEKHVTFEKSDQNLVGEYQRTSANFCCALP